MPNIAEVTRPIQTIQATAETESFNNLQIPFKIIKADGFAFPHTVLVGAVPFKQLVAGTTYAQLVILPRSINTIGTLNIPGILSETVPQRVAQFIGYSENVGKLDWTIPFKRLSITGIASITGELSQTKLMQRFTSYGGRIFTGSVIVAVPMRAVDGDGSIVITGKLNEPRPFVLLDTYGVVGVVTESGELIVMNLKTRAVSKYDKFEYSSLATVGQSVYISKDDGIYLLDGNENVSKEITLPKMDFAIGGYLCRPKYVYLEVEGRDLILTCNGYSIKYDYAKDDVRIKLGKGFKDRIYTFGINTDKNITLRRFAVDSYVVRSKRR